MYKSQELRWFFKVSNEPVDRWFSDRGKVFAKTTPRSDFYMLIPGKEDLNIKLREGNVEIKQRSGTGLLNNFSKNAAGYMENWVKWSFNVEDKDELSRNIIIDKKYGWVEVYKERIGIKLTPAPDGTLAVLDINDRIPYGCQIEYSRLVIYDREWYTFGLEWFGDQYITIGNHFFEQILGESRLNEEDSFGYNAFLNGKILK
ncbi:MAG: hypothetical protein NT040_12050 [Bacteroidetes bacterium]|nr:hypothetical protein [Bacteroidota bacterium]